MSDKVNPENPSSSFKERCYGIYHNLIIDIGETLVKSIPAQHKVIEINDKIRFAWGESMVEGYK